MRTLLMVLMIAGLMSTVGVYAASLGTPALKATGGSGSTTVAAPNTGAVSVTWNLTGNDITGANVTWTPSGSLVHQIVVTAGTTTGTFTTPATTGGTARTDTVTLAATDPATVSAAEVVITAQ